jgi:hypothetical protein
MDKGSSRATATLFGADGSGASRPSLIVYTSDRPKAPSCDECGGNFRRCGRVRGLPRSGSTNRHKVSHPRMLERAQDEGAYRQTCPLFDAMGPRRPARKAESLPRSAAGVGHRAMSLPEPQSMLKLRPELSVGGSLI